jgi:uncharacterized repeat protein (TIGR01451 family)
MKRKRLVLLGFVFGAILQAPIAASAQEGPTPIVLPDGAWDVTATVDSKMADNLLEFGLSSPQEVQVCPQGEATDCAPGDTETIEDLSGELVFYLTDITCSGEEFEETFFSTDGSSAEVTQVDDTHWTIGWDDAGNCEIRDGDKNDLVVSIAAHGADLSITNKSDDAPFGPDPVSSGGTVAYLISVSNAGPDPATGVSVFDAPEGGTIVSAAGTEPESAWTCDVDSESNTATCDLAGSLGSGEPAEGLLVQVEAPASETDTSISDTATVSANESDPDLEDNSETETTTVQGSSNPATQDHAQTFYDGTQEVTLETTRDTAGGFYSRLIIPPGLQPGVVTIDEYPADQPIPGFPTIDPLTYCGGSPCVAQFQVTVLPGGQTPADDAIQVFWFYTDGTGGNKLYVKGDGETIASEVKDCRTPGIAFPAKCRDSITRLPNKDREYVMLWRDGGDPVGAKRK